MKTENATMAPGGSLQDENVSLGFSHGNINHDTHAMLRARFILTIPRNGNYLLSVDDISLTLKSMIAGQQIEFDSEPREIMFLKED